MPKTVWLPLAVCGALLALSAVYHERWVALAAGLVAFVLVVRYVVRDSASDKRQREARREARRGNEMASPPRIPAGQPAPTAGLPVGTRPPGPAPTRPAGAAHGAGVTPDARAR